MSNSSWIVTWLAMAAVLVTSARATSPDNTPSTHQPSYLFIAVDDLNDWVGPLGGHPQARTPNIDRLARRGMVFTNAHCQAPLCNPSRASILSGLRPSTTGLYSLLPGVRSVPALRNRTMLPRFLQEHGYATFGTGKIFHDGSLTADERANEFGKWGITGEPPLPPQKFVETRDPIKAMDWGVFPEQDEDQGDWKIASSAIDWLKTLPASKPYFLSVGFRYPHVPCFASQKWFDLYPESTIAMPPVKEDDRSDVPDFAWYLHWKLPEPRLSWLKAHGQWKPLVRAYLASISFMDSQVGRLLDALDKSGRSNETVIVVWSDHGWHLGEKGITGKNSLWERSTRVPLIIAGPGIAKARCTRPVELLDLYPTLAELSGLQPPDGLDGHSLGPLLKNPKSNWRYPAITTANRNSHSVRSERWRYIRYADGSEELYDHRSDPNEWTNLAGQPRFGAIKKEHARWLPQTNLPAVQGSAVRLLEYLNGTWIWEGKPIRWEDLER